MNRPTVLFYDPAGEAWGSKIRRVCAVQGLRLRPLSPADLGHTVLALAQGHSAEEEPPEAEPVDEPILIFCHLTSHQLDSLLKALRKEGIPRACLKAVLTASNSQWTLRALYDELCQEREQLS